VDAPPLPAPCARNPAYPPCRVRFDVIPKEAPHGILVVTSEPRRRLRNLLAAARNLMNHAAPAATCPRRRTSRFPAANSFARRAHATHLTTWFRLCGRLRQREDGRVDALHYLRHALVIQRIRGVACGLMSFRRRRRTGSGWRRRTVAPTEESTVGILVSGGVPCTCGNLSAQADIACSQPRIHSPGGPTRRISRRGSGSVVDYASARIAASTPSTTCAMRS
jgi:hypothetical protein